MKIELAYRGLRALADSHGGELVSVQNAAGTEYIWGGDPAFWHGINPLLFPIVGSLKDGTVCFDGAAYRMERHGFARNMEFSVAAQDESSVLFTLRETEQTLTQYPYPFLLQVRHSLNETGFTTALSVTNTGSKPMPFCIGAHTAFRCPLQTGESFEDYEVIFDRAETADLILLNARGEICHGQTEPLLRENDRFPLARSVFERLDTMIFEDPASTGVSLRHRSSGHGVHVSFEGFPMIAFWTKSGCEAPFLCIEPWHGCAAYDNESGNFTDKPHCITLLPGKQKELRYTVTLL